MLDHLALAIAITNNAHVLRPGYRFVPHKIRQQIALIQSIQPVSKRDAGLTVLKINTPGSSGSGVLVNMPDGQLALVTAKHVADQAKAGESLSVVISKNMLLEISGSDVLVMPGIDAAVLKINENNLRILNSTKTPLRPAKISYSTINVGQNVFAAGYPIDLENAVTGEIRVTPGAIQTISSDQKNNGFAIGYTSKTYQGMSGGGLFTSDGLLVGIHGRGEALKSDDQNKTGTNFAVPIIDIINWYRNNHAKKSSGANVEAASLFILNDDYKSALPAWEAVQIKYPDSLITSYNVDCIRAILSRRVLNLSKYSPLFDSFTGKGNLMEWLENQRRRAAYTYLNDSLVRKYSNGGEPIALLGIFGLMQGHQGMGNACDPFVLTNRIESPEMPFQGASYVKTERNLWPTLKN